MGMALEIVDATLGFELVDYQMGWEQQRGIHAGVVSNTLADTVILLEHAPVYTAGRRTENFERPTDGTPVVDVDRGGKITWHGPGQLVGYPIVHLPNAMDVVSHVRRLEDVIIGICTDFGLATSRIKGRSGVWVLNEVQDRKIAAIGIRVAQGVTMHGFALNCNNDLSWFDRIVPCGITDAGVTTLSAELNKEITVTEVRDSAIENLIRVFEPLIPGYSLNQLKSPQLDSVM
jgi:lipoyl(octanoyl) transferase